MLYGVFYDEKTKKYHRAEIGYSERGFEPWRDAMIELLEYYKEDYYLDEYGIIYITKKLWRDKKKLSGYCKEADERVGRSVY
jgi:hypothetical protein